MFSEALQEARGALARAACHAARLEKVGHHRDAGAASIGELAERFGLASGPVARSLARAGRVMALRPDLEAFLTSGATTVDHLSEYLEILRDPELVRDGDDWDGWLRADTYRALRRRVRVRLAEKRRRDVPTTVHLSIAGRTDLERARALISRGAKSVVSLGQTVETATRDWLSRNDVLHKTERARRKGPTEGDASRYVPASVQRKVLGSGYDVCCLPYCDHGVFLEFAHRKPHSAGGGREAENLLRICPTHHTMLDAGWLTVTRGASGEVFLNRYGEDIGRPRPPPSGES